MKCKVQVLWGWLEFIIWRATIILHFESTFALLKSFVYYVPAVFFRILIQFTVQSIYFFQVNHLWRSWSRTNYVLIFQLLIFLIIKASFELFRFRDKLLDYVGKPLMHYKFSFIIICNIIIFLETTECALSSIARIIDMIGSSLCQR